ncbi:MAG: hypothetical protein R3C60_06400 [Parvularculaceae bacterium]
MTRLMIFTASAMALLAACGKSEAGAPANTPNALAQAAAASAAAKKTSGDYLRFEPTVVVDSTGFERPMGAFTLFMPAGWRAEGGVQWGQQFDCTNGYNVSWRAVSPDGAKTIEILPQAKWEQNTYAQSGAGRAGPCGLPPSQNVKDYLQILVQQWRPGARIIDFRRRTDLEQKLAQLNSRTPTAMGEMRSWVEAGEVLVAFNQNGVDMRGSIAAAVGFTYTSTSAPGLQPIESFAGFALPAYAATAPNGQLNFALNEAIRRSIKENPVWSQRIAGHNNKMAQINIDGARKRAEITRQYNNDISRIREETWKSYNESSDKRAREFSEYIRDVETYNDPDGPGGTVELSSFYEHAYKMNDGSYVLTNDPNFEPYRELGMDGTRLEVTQ